MSSKPTKSGVKKEKKEDIRIVLKKIYKGEAFIFLPKFFMQFGFQANIFFYCCSNTVHVILYLTFVLDIK